ncbi:MAG: phosphoenolpyruvate mutase [Lachnospiraceae bacterium]
MEKKVYIAFAVDIIHQGHIHLIKEAAKLGKLTVGLLPDEAIAGYKRYPILGLEARKEIIANIKGVDEVVIQEGIDYEANLEKLKPDYVVHGDDWKTNFQKLNREKVISVLKRWGGTLVEIPYSQGNGIEQIEESLKIKSGMPEFRRGKLKKLLREKPMLRVLEVHNGLSGLIVENTKIINEDLIVHSFDAMWLSSLTDSTAKGKPDIELVDMTSRIHTINEILEVTTKPIILDGDTGGLIEHFVYNVKTVERMGISAIIIEDKIGLKKNSLWGTEVEQTQDSVESFSEKIRRGCNARLTSDFMIIARIESLILKKGIKDAIHRAKAYIDAGADGIMIHSRENTPTEIFEFCNQYNQFEKRVPLVVVPTAYNQVYEEELQEHGVNITIYANQLIRSEVKAMTETSNSILINHRAYEAEKNCISIKETLALIPENK